MRQFWYFSKHLGQKTKPQEESFLYYHAEVVQTGAKQTLWLFSYINYEYEDGERR